MGVKLDRLPDYLDKWDVDFKLLDGWQDRARASGDFVDVLGVIVHHTATSCSVARDLEIMYTQSADRPVGNGLIARDGVFHLGSVRATNTAGKGGPRLTSRGVIPLDAANSRTFSIEAQNNGVGEPWTPEMIAAYPRLCAAIIDCVNSTTPGEPLGAGDAFGHFEWTTRKIDPAGPSPWCNDDDRYMRWLMDDFRGAVFTELMAGPPVPPPPPTPPSTEVDVKHVTAPERAQMIVGPGYCHWAESAEEGYEMNLLYGAAVPVSTRDYDVIVHIHTVDNH